MPTRLAASAAALGLVLRPAPGSAEDLAFVACPIVQDTNTVPCWLSDFGGETYYLGIQSDVSAPFNPPSLGHMALIEGTPHSDERICGGIVLEPVKVSVLPALAPQCDEMRMVRPGLELPFEPPRPPGPSGGRLAYSPPPPPPPPQAPFEPKSFDIYFPFEGTVDFKTPGSLQVVLDYAEAVGAKRLEVTGYRASARLSDGTMIEERAGIAATRAREVGRMFEGLIDSVGLIDIASSEEAQMGDWHQRKVVITVYP